MGSRLTAKQNSKGRSKELAIKAVLLALIFVIALSPSGCKDRAETKEDDGANNIAEQTASVKEGGSYDSRDDVAAYIREFGKLPKNYITKKEARKLGWRGGSLEEYAPGKAIGGDRFGNREKKLPVKQGRTYYECDIDTLGASNRGPKRIVFSDDGLIYYTEDHYNSFRQLE